MISLIAAMSMNYQIGLNGQMPWHIPEDLAYFKAITTQHTVVMGRKTYESIGHALPNRNNIVITRNQNLNLQDATVIHTPETLITLADSQEELFVIGGGELYRYYLPYTTTLYLTLNPTIIAGDTTFPRFKTDFELIDTIPGATQIEGQPISFTKWHRKPLLLNEK